MSAGLPLRSAIDVVIFAIACMALNVLVGYTGLVSFGHGAWFGLGAYAAALRQRYWFPGDIDAAGAVRDRFSSLRRAVLSGALILRRRGVYFSLLTLALTALLFAIGYRWTELTGGESGLGGVTRATRARHRSRTRLDLLRRWSRWLAWRVVLCCSGASTARRSAACWSRSARTSSARRFVGYPTNRYKLIALRALRDAWWRSPARCPCSITVSRRPSRSPSRSRASSSPWWSSAGCEVSSGRRSARLFFILFREFLSIWTPHWLFYFGLLFVGFIVFSPTGLVGVAERLIAPFRKRVVEAAGNGGPHAIGGRAAAADLSPSAGNGRRRRWWHATSSSISAASMRSTASSSTVQRRGPCTR